MEPIEITNMKIKTIPGVVTVTAPRGSKAEQCGKLTQTAK